MGWYCNTLPQTYCLKMREVILSCFYEAYHCWQGCTPSTALGVSGSLSLPGALDCRETLVPTVVCLHASRSLSTPPHPLSPMCVCVYVYFFYSVYLCVSVSVCMGLVHSRLALNTLFSQWWLWISDSLLLPPKLGSQACTTRPGKCGAGDSTEDSPYVRQT